MEERKKGGSFSGSLGFILAAAGSAVGLGNIWRFPYLAAKGGAGKLIEKYFADPIFRNIGCTSRRSAAGHKEYTTDH